MGGTSAAEPNLSLRGMSDCEDFAGRHIEYWLVKPTNALEDQPYVVFEHQTDHSLAPPNGVSPLDYKGVTNKFDDLLRTGVDGTTHVSDQTFTFGLPGQRLFDVKRIRRHLANSDVSLKSPTFRIVIRPNQ